MELFQVRGLEKDGLYSSKRQTGMTVKTLARRAGVSPDEISEYLVRLKDKLELPSPYLEGFTVTDECVLSLEFCLAVIIAARIEAEAEA